MIRAEAGLAARINFTLNARELTQLLGVFIVNHVAIGGTEEALFFLIHKHKIGRPRAEIFALKPEGRYNVGTGMIKMVYLLHQSPLRLREAL